MCRLGCLIFPGYVGAEVQSLIIIQTFFTNKMPHHDLTNKMPHHDPTRGIQKTFSSQILVQRANPTHGLPCRQWRSKGPEGPAGARGVEGGPPGWSSRRPLGQGPKQVVCGGPKIVATLLHAEPIQHMVSHAEPIQHMVSHAEKESLQVQMHEHYLHHAIIKLS